MTTKDELVPNMIYELQKEKGLVHKKDHYTIPGQSLSFFSELLQNFPEET